MRVTDARLIFLLLRSFSSPLRFVSYFFAATLLPEVAFAQQARPGNFCLAGNRGFADIGFSNVIYPFPWSPVPRSPLEACIKRYRWFIIRVRRPARRRPILVNSDGYKTLLLLTCLCMFVLSFQYLLIFSNIREYIIQSNNNTYYYKNLNNYYIFIITINTILFAILYYIIILYYCYYCYIIILLLLSYYDETYHQFKYRIYLLTANDVYIASLQLLYNTLMTYSRD